MSLHNIDIENHVRLARDLREAQMQRSQMLAYLTATQSHPSFAYRARRSLSAVLFALAGIIKPTPNRQAPEDLWVPKRLPGS